MSKENITGIIRELSAVTTAKSGSKYCQIKINELRGVLFVKTDEAPFKIGDTATLVGTKKDDGQYLFNLPTERKGGGFRAPQMNKELEALKLSVSMVNSGKVDINQLKEWQDYLKSLF
jgi:hypothetical protein